MLKKISEGNRSVKAKKSIILMLIIKGLGILINLAFVPLLIDILNTEKYGIWLTVTTLSGWLAFFDIGLGHGLRNKLSESISKGDYELSKQYVSTTYVALFFIVLILVIIQFIFTPMINWASVLNAPQEMNMELTLLVTWIIFLVCIQFLFKLITSVMLALQMPAFSSLVVTLGQFLAFIVIYSATHSNLDLSLLQLGIIISLSPIIILLISTLFIFAGKYKMYAPSFSAFRKELIHPVLLLGTRFFSIQITALILFQSDNIIIAHVAGPESVAEFNIAYKYIGIINMVFAIITIPYWSATTEAYFKNDFKWIRQTIQTLNKYWMIMLLSGVLMIICAPFFYHLWMGDDGIKSNLTLLMLIFVYYLFYMRWTLYGSIINGIGKIKLQFYMTLLEVVFHIPVAILLGKLWGLTGVIISMIIVGIINSIWPPIQLKKILDKTAKGVWNK